MRDRNNMIIRSSTGFSFVTAESKLFSDERKIYISGEINDDMMVEFSQKIQVLMMNDKEEPISIYIDSYGGDVRSGLAMYEMIRSLSNIIEVDIYCLGKACSMAAVLLAAGTKGHRYLMPYSEVMIHEPLISTKSQIKGTTSTVRSLAASLEDTKRIIDTILSVHTGKTIEEISESTSFDNYMSAKEACEFGIADKIVSFDLMI